jgi:hypothetical protein
MSKFTCQLPVKSYIKAYIENNCGHPAELSHLPDIKQLFISCLRNPRFNRDSQAKCNYTHNLEILLSEDAFYRYGWELSNTDVVRFNQKCESIIKFNSRQFIAANASLGMPVSKCIREFQRTFNFSEDAFPFETIKKDFDRHGRKVPINIILDYKVELNNILLDNLSGLGTVSNLFKNELDNKT